MKHGEAAKTSTLSRDHTILVSESGLITITGGKWTTYRKMAEDVVNRAEEVSGLTKRRCETAELPLHGWTQSGMADPFKVYGTDAVAIAKLIQGNSALGERLHPRLEYVGAEVIWQVRQEMARTVEDVLSRRTRRCCSMPERRLNPRRL